MTITAEDLRSRQRRARLSQDTTSVNQENHHQNGLSLQQIYSLHPAGLRCCSGGCKILTPLPPLPARIQQMVAENSIDIARYSCGLNYLFALSAIGVSGLTSGWSQYTGDAIWHSNLPIIYSV